MYEEDKNSQQWTGIDDKQTVIEGVVKGQKKRERERLDTAPGETSTLPERKHRPLFGREKTRDYYSTEWTDQASSCSVTSRQCAGRR